MRLAEVRAVRTRRRAWRFWELVVLRRPWAFRVSVWLGRDGGQ